MSGKFCIFCGEKPKNKNLEHVIPQWLIRLSNNEHEDVYSLFPEGHRKINFMQFKFPACTECNSKYAELEAKVKGIMEKVLAGQSINGMEASPFGFIIAIVISVIVSGLSWWILRYKRLL